MHRRQGSERRWIEAVAALVSGLCDFRVRVRSGKPMLMVYVCIALDFTGNELSALGNVRLYRFVQNLQLDALGVSAVDVGEILLF
jgi:hypothetical protein